MYACMGSPYVTINGMYHLSTTAGHVIPWSTHQSLAIEWELLRNPHNINGSKDLSNDRRVRIYLQYYVQYRKCIDKEQHGELIWMKISVPRVSLWHNETEQYTFDRFTISVVIYLFIPRGWYVVTTLRVNRICQSFCVIRYKYNIIRERKIKFSERNILIGRWMKNREEHLS